jgi:CRP-like cAMP-binding protein
MNPLFEKFIGQYLHGVKDGSKVQHEIASHLSVVELNKNHILLRENQHHDFAYFVVEGAVRSEYLVCV